MIAAAQNKKTTSTLLFYFICVLPSYEPGKYRQHLKLPRNAMPFEILPGLSAPPLSLPISCALGARMGMRVS